MIGLKYPGFPVNVRMEVRFYVTTDMMDFL